MSVPKWAAHLLTEKDFETIKSAVAEAEASTEGEIVPMIVRRSSAVGHVPVIVGLVLVLIYLLIEWPMHQWLSESLQWAGFGVFCVLFFPLVRLISGREFIQRNCISAADREQQVFHRAELEFYSNHLDHTGGATGILILLSLMERQAVVLADKTISEKLPADTWQEVVNLLIDGIRQRQAGDGVVKAVRRCGELLAAHFPIKKGDQDELPNNLIFKD